MSPLLYETFLPIAFLGIDNSLYINPDTLSIVGASLEDTPSIANFTTASEGGVSGLDFSAAGRDITIVPEPSYSNAIAAMCGLGIAYRALRRRRK